MWNELSKKKPFNVEIDDRHLVLTDCNAYKGKNNALDMILDFMNLGWC